ncbi:hypothetical protein Sste5346_006648 [Sporothrix stenoceras]|uniref:Uncharacterized protein n=1 Tax=Sporothrix stenoceras TaxID=5173 RepID=A0ABR3Z0A8_9PEZI
MSGTNLGAGTGPVPDNGEGGNAAAIAPVTTGLLPPEHWTQLGQVRALKYHISSESQRYYLTCYMQVNVFDNDDTESARARANLSSTASISSSIVKYRTIQGRTYHSELGNASYCDFADQYPNATVIGTDISPIQPSDIDDYTREWSFPDNDFDFVHAYRVTAPGGYLESYEGSPNVRSDDDTLPSGTAMAQWGPLFINGGKLIGRSFSVVDDDIQKKAMAAAGFVDIQDRLIKVPSGPWTADPRVREIGVFSQRAVESDIEGFILFFTNVQ